MILQIGIFGSSRWIVYYQDSSHSKICANIFLFQKSFLSFICHGRLGKQFCSHRGWWAKRNLSRTISFFDREYIYQNLALIVREMPWCLSRTNRANCSPKNIFGIISVHAWHRSKKVSSHPVILKHVVLRGKRYSWRYMTYVIFQKLYMSYFPWSAGV